jgi:hypothetical protein
VHPLQRLCCVISSLFCPLCPLTFCRYQLLWFTLSHLEHNYLFSSIRLLGSHYYSLITLFFPIFFFPFYYLSPSYVYSRNTYNVGIQPFILDSADGQGPGGNGNVLFTYFFYFLFFIFFRLYLITSNSVPHAFSVSLSCEVEIGACVWD